MHRQPLEPARVLLHDVPERGGVASAGALVTAPGHNALITDDAGVDWMLYHANAGPQCAPSYCPRFLYLDRVAYNVTARDGSTGWPSVGVGGVPSTTPQQAPTVVAATAAAAARS